MCEGEMEAPAREIVIEFKNSEDGGGVSIDVRADGEPIEKLVEIVEHLLDKISGIKPISGEDVEVA
ncbi:MAG: hypothetical protein H0Z19_09405 [Archaeoglobus sp.]|uniref:hypothetical protein n=1 Tax=Archaeoglobus sp. TaxID=1872626 RepID=UPI001E030C33|nr:hypothetical protein [Archaeoglobus sp.]MBO8180672.1 hypothetical protein [Archaeoglobus sp.]